jgi:hypothetical protein
LLKFVFPVLFSCCYVLLLFPQAPILKKKESAQDISANSASASTSSTTASTTTPSPLTSPTNAQVKIDPKQAQLKKVDTAAKKPDPKDPKTAPVTSPTGSGKKDEKKDEKDQPNNEVSVAMTHTAKPKMANKKKATLKKKFVPATEAEVASLEKAETKS